MTPRIDPSRYAAILNTIAQGESDGNYNAYYGNSRNTSVRFTDMTLSQVLHWQTSFLDNGAPSSAVGKYQIVQPTLRGLMDELDIDDSARFDAALQDRMAIALLERRGAVEYVKGTIDRRTFAANLAKEWAALPRMTGPNPGQSYYAGDGINAARVSSSEVLRALRPLKY